MVRSARDGTPFGPVLVRIIEKAIAKSPSDRYQTAADFRADVESALRYVNVAQNVITSPIKESLISLTAKAERPNRVTGPVARAVLNPALFEYLGKKLRVAFLQVEGYGSFAPEKFSQRSFELYSVLGDCDIIVTHLDQAAYALFYDVNQSLAWKLAGAPGGVPEDALQQFPYFEVTSYHKVLGVAVSASAANSFLLHPPLPEDIEKLIDLGIDWNGANSADDGFRSLARQNGWILGTKTPEPSELDAVMTIHLDHPEEIAMPAQRFERAVLPALIEEPAVTSIFEGAGHRLAAHYILRISATQQELHPFVQNLHRMAEEGGW